MSAMLLQLFLLSVLLQLGVTQSQDQCVSRDEVEQLLDDIATKKYVRKRAGEVIDSLTSSVTSGTEQITMEQTSIKSIIESVQAEARAQSSEVTTKLEDVKSKQDETKAVLDDTLVALNDLGQCTTKEATEAIVDNVIDMIHSVNESLQDEITQAQTENKNYFQSTMHETLNNIESIKKAQETVAEKVNQTLSIVEDSATKCVTREEVQSIVQSIVDELRSEVQASHSSMQVGINARINNIQSSTRAEIQTSTTSVAMSTQSEIQALESRLLQHFPRYLNGTFQNPATSCREVPQGSPSSNYWIISTTTGSLRLKYCDMTRRCCSSTGGWMRVANLDMADPNQQCPSGFRTVTSPRRTCGRPGVGCVSTTFPVHGVEYSRVCGKIKGYQYHSMDAFAPYYDNRSITIDDVYVDGVSLTHGQSPRKHIWTFANAHDENYHPDQRLCPCSNTRNRYTGVIPSFIGQDYFCDSGTRGGTTNRLYTEDQLWDGQGCGPTSSCCSFNNPPWFCKQLPQPTSDDIEMRLCADQDIDNEDSRLEIVEIYVQ